MRQYKSYHTILKQLASKGHLPDMYLNQIDRTTLWRWKMEPDDKYTGKELSSRVNFLEVLLHYCKEKFWFYFRNCRADIAQEKIRNISKRGD